MHDYNKVTLFNKFCYAIFTATNIATPTDTGRYCITKYLNWWSIISDDNSVTDVFKALNCYVHVILIKLLELMACIGPIKGPKILCSS